MDIVLFVLLSIIAIAISVGVALIYK